MYGDKGGKTPVLPRRTVQSSTGTPGYNEPCSSEKLAIYSEEIGRIVSAHTYSALAIVK